MDPCRHGVDPVPNLVEAWSEGMPRSIHLPTCHRRSPFAATLLSTSAVGHQARASSRAILVDESSVFGRDSTWSTRSRFDWNGVSSGWCRLPFCSTSSKTVERGLPNAILIARTAWSPAYSTPIFPDFNRDQPRDHHSGAPRGLVARGCQGHHDRSVATTVGAPLILSVIGKR